MEQNLERRPPRQLVRAVEQLSPAELDLFADEVTALRARRHAPMLSEDESHLFAIINRALPEADRMRLAELIEGLHNENLISDEHRELLQLQHRLEALHAERVKALARLAQLRGVTLTRVMDQLDIHFPDYV